MEISLIIPMYNEEKFIENTLNNAIKYLKKNKYSYEIIVVDDGSTDKTVEKVKKFKDVKLVKLDKNMGKGYAVKQGVLNAEKENIVYMDADLPYPIESIKELLNFGNSSVVIGSRATAGAEVKSHPSISRKVLGRCFNLLMKIIVGLEFTDTQSGFKSFKKDAAKQIFNKTTINRWGFDVEALFLASKYNHGIKQIPINLLEQHSFRKSRLNTFKDPLVMFRDLLRIRINNILRKY